MHVCMILTINCFSPVQDYVFGVCSGNVTCVMTVGSYVSKYLNDVWLSSDKESKIGIQRA